MYGMNLDEALLCAKLVAYAIGDRSVSLNQIDRDAAVVLLKRMADQNWNWTEQQKEQYKFYLDVCNQIMRQN